MIDHTAFPHILDTVVSYATPETLLRLRATSSAMRAKCQAHLLAHVVISDSGLSTPCGLRIPLRWQRGAHHSQAVDIGYLGPSAMKNYSTDAFRHVSVLRYLAPSQRNAYFECRLHTRRVVLFLDMEHVPPTGQMVFFPQQATKRLVINLLHWGYPDLHSRPFWWDLPEVDELVLVLGSPFAAGEAKDIVSLRAQATYSLHESLLTLLDAGWTKSFAVVSQPLAVEAMGVLAFPNEAYLRRRFPERKIAFLSWDEYCASSLAGLETDEGYRASREELAMIDWSDKGFHGGRASF